MKKNRCELHGDKFFITYKGNRSCCKKCRNERIFEYRRYCKKTLVGLFGGKCEICGYSKSVRSLQFHHIDPSTKSFSLGHWSNVLCLEKMLEEAKKCLLLCANCHGEVEEGTTVVPVSLSDRGKTVALLIAEKNKFVAKKKKKCFNKVCPVCLEKFSSIIEDQHCCSLRCNGILQRKIERPSKDELKIMLWQMPTVKIASRFGVTDKAIEKWAKGYELLKPPRGYWTKTTSRPTGGQSADNG